MRELFLAWQLAAEVARPESDFAVEIDAFTNLGATHAEIRYLLCTGCIEHRIDCALPEQAERLTVPTESLRLTSRSCFLLTVKGVEMAQRLFDSDGDGGSPSVSNAEAGSHWDSERRTLSFNGVVVQTFGRHAPAQERILIAFEEEGWTAHIDDPLPPIGKVDRKSRLNKTIHRLNKHLRSTRVQFHADGSGEGICWHENSTADCASDEI